MQKGQNHFSMSDLGSWCGFLEVLGASLYWRSRNFDTTIMAKMTPDLKKWFWAILHFSIFPTIEANALIIAPPHLTQKENCKDNFRDLWHLRHWLKFWQLRAWIRDNHCYLTIKSDCGQHSQFLRCFFWTRPLWQLCNSCNVIILLSSFSLIPSNH